MTIKEIYEIAVKKGTKDDSRDDSYIKNNQRRLKEKYQKMSSQDKKYFDTERLVNPFSDTRILFGDPNKKVNKILAGIDIDGSEIILAKEMKDIDLVISHHPIGRALAGLYDVMQLQVDLLNSYGVPVNVAEKLLKKRIEEVSRGLSPINHNRVVDFAKHLNVPLLCVHTPCDNMAAKFIEDKFRKDKPFFVQDIIKSLLEMPEYQEAAKIGAGPRIFLGSNENRAGRIITEMTGGTEGSPETYEKLSQAGIGTVVGMHMSEKHRTSADKANINIVIAGHMSSDSVGMNIFFDELEKKGIDVVSCSGFTRFSRV
jgi:putative NIF3 family GTP cyclohydrolase 1 type 2